MIRVWRVMGGGVAVSTAGVLVKVHSAGSETTKSGPKKYHPSQLSVYGDPEATEFEVVPEKETAFRNYISSARQRIWKYLESVQSTTDKVKEKYEVAKAHTQDALAYIHEDSSVIPRATIITVAGLGGLVAGYRGGILRKAFYATVGMTAAASACYPHEAEDIAKQGWNEIRDFARNTYDESFGASKNLGVKTTEVKKPKAEEPKHDDKPQTPKADSSATKGDSSATKGDSSATKGDVGMSKAEDKDLYSTRGN